MKIKFLKASTESKTNLSPAEAWSAEVELLPDAQVSGAWTLNKIHAYYGKKGAIDLVVQDLSSVDMRETADRRGTNVFSSYLAGLKTFIDGSKKFLNVKIAA
jgi:hypothetical protein